MYLLRHGQSLFNAHFTEYRRDPGIPDPGLTETGFAQASAAAEALRDAGLTRILSSPYTRAIQTATPVSEATGVPITVHPLVRERYAFSCDIGSPAGALARAWPHIAFDHLEPVWWPAEDEPEATVVARAALVRAEFAALPDWRTTLLVSHWGFLLALTGASIANGQLARFDPTEAAPKTLVWRV